MRHIIVHVIRGEAGQFHINTTKKLTEKFDAFALHDRIVPHLTLKRWFELEEKGMNKLYKTLDDFSTSHSQSNYELKGYGNFGKDVIYIDVKTSQEMSATIADLYKRLHEIKELTFDEFDVAGKLHATVAFGALKPFGFDKTWNYLAQEQQPDFKMKFDNIAIFKKPLDTWVLDRSWELKP